MIVSIIVATDEKGGIGKDGQLPWHLPSDLKRFKQLTMGHHIVMGRKTYETIGRPLKGRVMIVITHKVDYSLPGCIVVPSLDAAIEQAKIAGENELFIIGGGEIFSQAFYLVDRIYLTMVYTNSNADVFFPKFDASGWHVIGEENIVRVEGDDYDLDFKILVKKS